jgi:hypothetical protein
MAQGDMNIANQGFPAFRADLNDQLEALVTNSSGATAPSTTFPHQWWLDTSTTPSTLRQRNADNDAWIVIGLLNQATSTFNLPVAQGGTGAATLTANNVLLGNGTSAVQAVAPGTSGNVLTSNGTTWESAAPTGGSSSVDVQTFNTSGTWTKPSFGSMARIQVWGGGGGGARQTSTSTCSGGGGGGYNEIVVPISSLGATETVTIGAGGGGRTDSTGSGTAGGNSSFGSLLSAFGGAEGRTGGSVQFSGGGGSLSAGTSVSVDSFTSLTGAALSPYGEPNNPLTLILQLHSLTQFPFHGGASTTGDSATRPGYDAVYGGAGGSSAGGSADFLGGVSLYGGNGGNGGRSTTDIDGTAPGGGGGARNNSLDGGNGADGRVIVTVW